MSKQYLTLDYHLVHSLTWKKGLSFSSKSLYIAMKASRYRKNKKGDIENRYQRIKFGYSNVKDEMAKDTYVRGIEELRIAGLIKLVIPGQFNGAKKAVYEFSNIWMIYERTKREESSGYSGQDK